MKTSSDPVTIEALFAAGVHFGHSPSRWHPKMAPFIHSRRAGRYLIDLEQTMAALETVAPVVTAAAATGGQILFISTKRQAGPIIRQAATEIGMPYVSERWMGGLLTNRQTIQIQVDKLKDLEARMRSGELTSKYNKLEVQNIQKRINNLNNVYGGIKGLKTTPQLVFVVDIISNAIAVAEARKLAIPIVAIVDTNVNPGLVDYPIPGNDDAITAIKLIVDFVKDAVQVGIEKFSREQASTGPAKVVSSDAAKPTAEPVTGVVG